MNVLVKLFTIFCVIISMSTSIQCARILCVFSAPILSHSIVLRRLSNGLHQKGHELVILTSFPEHPNIVVPNLTEIDLGEVSYQAWNTVADGWSGYIKEDLNRQKEIVLKLIINISFAQLRHKEIEIMIKDEIDHFDLIFIEISAKPLYILSHIFKAPVILVSSMGELILNEEFGTSVQPILYPPFMAPKFNKLSFLEKIYVLYEYYWFQNLCVSQEAIINEMLKKRFGEDTPDFNVLSSNLDMIFLNVHTCWEANRPVPLGIIFLGGLHLAPEKKLPDDLNFYLDTSRNGIIYVSFGTNIVSSLFPRERLKILLNVLSKLPYDILFKWDQENLPGCPENVKIFKWLPQADLLHHPKIKLFITQGGLQSTDEAIIAGVPLIGIPTLGDQWFNAEKYEQHEIGIKLELSTFTEEQFKEAIETVIGDEKYRQNVIKLRSIMYDKPQASLDFAIRWTEYVLRHGGAGHLRAPGANIPWVEFYEVELAFLLFSTLIVIIFSFIYCIKLCIIVVQKLWNLTMKFLKMKQKRKQ